MPKTGTTCSLDFPPLGHKCGPECNGSVNTQKEKKPPTWAGIAGNGNVPIPTKKSAPAPASVDGFPTSTTIRDTSVQKLEKKIALDVLQSLHDDTCREDQRMSAIDAVLRSFPEGSIEHNQAVFLKQEEERNVPSDAEMNALFAAFGLKK